MLAAAGHRPRPIRRRLQWVLLSVLGAVVALAIAVAAWAYYHRDEFTIGLFRPGPEALLQEVIAKSGLPADGAGPVETVDLDGTMPASASRTLEVGRPAQDITAMVVRACRQLGFAAPDGLERSAEPDLMCRGDWKEWSASVHLTTTCSRGCDATITTRAI